MRVLPFMKRKNGIQFAGVGLDAGGGGGGGGSSSTYKYDDKTPLKKHYATTGLDVSTSTAIVIDGDFSTSFNDVKIVRVSGCLLTQSASDPTQGFNIPITCASDPTRISCLMVVNVDGELRLLITTVGAGYRVVGYDLEIEYIESEV